VQLREQAHWERHTWARPFRLAPARQLVPAALGPRRGGDRQCPAPGSPPKYGAAAAALPCRPRLPPAFLRPCPAAQRLKSVDFYRKLPTDLTEATLSGAAISIATTFIILFLLRAVRMRTAPAAAPPPAALPPPARRRRVP